MEYSLFYLIRLDFKRGKINKKNKDSTTNLLIFLRLALSKIIRPEKSIKDRNRKSLRACFHYERGTEPSLFVLLTSFLLRLALAKILNEPYGLHSENSFPHSEIAFIA